MLTPAQQKIIEDSLWVVNAVLKRLGLQEDEDLRQDACLYLCKCLERFNPDKNVKWTTYAYKNIYLYTIRIKKYNNSKSLCLMEELENFNKSDNGLIEQQMETLCQFEHIVAPLPTKEKQVAILLSQGFTMHEIATLLKTNHKGVKELKQHIGNRLF